MLGVLCQPDEPYGYANRAEPETSMPDSVQRQHAGEFDLSARSAWVQRQHTRVDVG